MASGGGNRPTNLSFSFPPAFSSSATLSSSLQTPDTNSFFLSSLTGSSGGKDAQGSMLGIASPSAPGAQSFSSLEELLNVTGINSPDLGGVGSHDGGGVDSLQQLAKEVESKQLADVQPPAAKRPHLDLQAPSLPTQSLTTHQQLPSNIRVQPLDATSQLPLPAVTIPSLLDMKAATGLSALPPARTLPSPQVASTSPVVPSLFSSGYQTSSSLSHLQPSTSNHLLKESNLLTAVCTNQTAPAPVMVDSSGGGGGGGGGGGDVSTSSLPSSFPFTTATSASFSQLSFPSPSLSTIPSSTSLNMPPPSLGFRPQLPPSISTSSAAMGNINVTFPHPPQPSGQSPFPSASSLSSAPIAQSFVSQAPPTSLPIQPPQGQQFSLGLGNVATTSPASNTTASSALSTTAISPIVSGPNPLIQLVQLYKQFHTQGDNQGMLKVKQQLNILIARQKIIAAQNSLRAASSGLGVQQSMASLPSASLNTGPTVVQGATTRPSQSQAASISVGLGQMSQVLPSGQTTQQTGGNLPLPPNFNNTGQLSTRLANQSKLQQPPTTSPQMTAPVLPASQPVLPSTGPATHGSLPLPNVSVAGMPSVMPIATSTMTVSQPPFSFPHQAPPPPPGVAVPSTVSTGPPPQPLPAQKQQLQQTGHAPDPIASQNLQQQIVKRLQTVIASLPESQRPKNIAELRDFVQKYSTLIAQNSLLDLSVPGGGGGGVPPLSAGGGGKSVAAMPPTSASPAPQRLGPSQSVSLANTRLSQAGAPIPSLLSSNMSLVQTAGGESKLPHLPPSSSTATPLLSTVGPSQMKGANASQSASAQVAEHFKSSLAGLSVSKVATVGGAVAAVPSVMPSSIVPPSMSMTGSNFAPVASTVHAPVTTQFTHKVGSVNSLLPANQTTSKSPAGLTQTPPPAPPTSTPASAATFSTPPAQGAPGIQPGVATPLPPGLTLETLGVLCRLPESDLMKLKIPPALLTAIKVWKERQPPSKSSAKASSATNRNNIPVLTATGPPNTAPGNISRMSAGQNQSLPPGASSAGMSPYSMKVGNTASSKNFLQASQTNKASPSAQGTQLQQPMVIPSSAGFPPRSLHAFIPSLPQNNTPQKSNSTTPSVHKHQTRYTTKIERQKAENERIQALAKALQSSEEARIAFRFSAHLDKMHTQLLSPDTVTPFRSHHDILARLLPYHVFAEPEPPPAAVEKADAVFESVAQVLLSRSRGLTSRFEQLVSKSDAEGGPEQLAMKMQLERLFIEGEQERIRQEDIEKQQAEQVAADLSLMADGVDAFEPDFSLGDAFCPQFDMSDTGIT